jgi:hypothetical protein
MKLIANKNGPRIGCFFAALWNACTILVFAALAAGFVGDFITELGREDPDLGRFLAGNGPPFLILILVALIFLAVGVFLLWVTARTMIAGFRVGTPEVVLSKDRVRVGESFQLTYRQQFKRAAEVQKINIKFYFRETATYQRGTDTYTVHHDVVHLEHQIPGGHFNGGQQFEQRLALAVPRDGMHTFEAYRNQLRWFVKVHVEIAGWPDYDHDYEIELVPELAGE